jgi:hypothetical protein
VGFGWLTRLGSSFLKIFLGDISKNLNFFRCGPETASVGEIGPRIVAYTAATKTGRERRESLDWACCSSLLVGHAA